MVCWRNKKLGAPRRCSPILRFLAGTKLHWLGTLVTFVSNWSIAAVLSEYHILACGGLPAWLLCRSEGGSSRKSLHLPTLAEYDFSQTIILLFNEPSSSWSNERWPTFLTFRKRHQRIASCWVRSGCRLRRMRSYEVHFLSSGKSNSKPVSAKAFACGYMRFFWAE